MTKKNKIVIAVLAVILIIGIVFAALTTNKGFLGKLTGSVDPSNGKSLTSTESTSFKSDYPLVQTQQRDLFYEPYPDGTIKYFRFDGNNFAEVTDGITEKTVTLECSYQKIPVKLYYLHTDAGTVGYGIFTSEQQSSVKLFSYVLVRMMDCPAAYKSAAKTDYILLTDMDAEDSYKTDKTYSDMYSFDIKTGKTALVMSQRDRTAQEDGTVSEGWTIFTDSSLNSEQTKDLFASTRVHDSKTANKLYSFMTVANSSAGKRANAVTVDNSPSYEIREKDKNYYCFVSTASGFDLIKNGDRKNPLKSFDGKFTNYCVSGDWIYGKASGEFTNIITGETKTVKKAEYSSLAGFTANESGTKFVLFANGANQSMIMYDTANNKTNAVTDSLFDSGICNFCFIDDNTVLFSSYTDLLEASNAILKF